MKRLKKKKRLKKRKDFRKELLTTKTRYFLDIINDDDKSNFIIYEYKKIR